MNIQVKLDLLQPGTETERPRVESDGDGDSAGGAPHDPPVVATNSTETSAPEQNSDQTPHAGPLNSSVLSVDQEMNISDLIGNNLN